MRRRAAPAAAPAVDMVNSPPHYTHGNVECIDAIQAQLTTEEFIGYLRGTIAKYNWRLMVKSDPHEDAQKMMWYQTKLVEVLCAE